MSTVRCLVNDRGLVSTTLGVGSVGRRNILLALVDGLNRSVIQRRMEMENGWAAGAGASHPHPGPNLNKTPYHSLPQRAGRESRERGTMSAYGGHRGGANIRPDGRDGRTKFPCRGTAPMWRYRPLWELRGPLESQITVGKEVERLPV